MKPNIFYKLTTDAEMNPIHPKLLCGRSTFFRRFASFQKTKLIPEDHDYGIAVGAPQTLHDGNLRMLNEDLKNTVGFSEGGDVLSENIVTIKEESLASRGHHVPVKVPCTETAKFYQLLTTIEDPSIHLVKESTVKRKDIRRQMASTSIRNLASHLAAVTYANLRHVTEKWNAPKRLPIGCVKL